MSVCLHKCPNVCMYMGACANSRDNYNGHVLGITVTLMICKIMLSSAIENMINNM